MNIRRSGFTLIELLVVVAIIAVLISILLPALGKARESARTIQCAARLRDYGIAIKLYSDTNNEWICIGDGSKGGGIHWAGAYQDFFHFPANLMNYCPSAPEPLITTGNWKGYYGECYELWQYAGSGNFSWKDLRNEYYKESKLHPYGLLLTDTVAWTYQTGDYGQYEEPRHGVGTDATNDPGKCNYLMPDIHVTTLSVPHIDPRAGGPAKIRDTIDEVLPNFN